jgi:outer membrane protein OmpA-like peptidoglycan-associated protein
MCYFKLACRVLSASLMLGLVWSATYSMALAQVPSDQILNALVPPVTRGLTVPQEPNLSDADRAFIDSLRHRTRSLTLDEGEHAVALGKDRPKIDLEIYFDYNSANVAPKAEPQLAELGNALRDSRLKGSVLVLGGYTDAKGSADYNQKLSERRAAAVKKYLVEKLKLPADGLNTVGYGATHLKNADEPFAPENRRVQIINLASTNDAQR